MSFLEIYNENIRAIADRYDGATVRPLTFADVEPDDADDIEPRGNRGRLELVAQRAHGDLVRVGRGGHQTSEKDDKGGWLRAQIDAAHEYAAEIKQMAEDGLLWLSSGSVLLSATSVETMYRMLARITDVRFER